MAIMEAETVAVTSAPTFTVNGATLKRALARVKPAVCKYGSPIVRGVRVTIGETVEITATDLDTTITVPLPGAEALEPGVMVVPFAALSAFLRKVTAKSTDVATVRLSEGEITVTLGRLSVRIPYLPAEEYPRTVALLDTEGCKPLDMATVADVASAMSGDETRPVLCSLGFIGADIVATDSYRLHLVRGAVDVGADVSVLAPASAVKVAVKHGGPALFGWTADTVSFVFDDMTVTGRRVDGTFPAYPNLIRVDSPGSLLFDRAELASALAELIPLAAPETPVRITTGDDGIGATLSISVQDVSAVTATVKCTAEGSAVGLLTAWNPRYLSELVAGDDGLNNGTVRLETDGALKPGVIRETSADGSERVRLVMPVRVS